MENEIKNEMDKVVEEISRYRLTDSVTAKHRKLTVLKSLLLEPEETKNYYTLLKEYRYVDEVDELRVGNYIRFFKLNVTTLSLCSGGFLVDIQLSKKMIVLLFKNRNKFFKIKMDECMLFQRNTPQEKILVQILDQIKR